MIDVVIAGAGPAGTLLATELRRSGLDVALLERRTAATAGSRAIGLHPPALRALEACGASERILTRAARVAAGVAVCRGRVIGRVRFDRPGARYGFIATVPQAVTEEALRACAPEPRRGIEVIRVRDDGQGVVVAYREGGVEGEMRARAAVIATGSDRALAGITAAERPLTDRYVMADLDSAPLHPPHTAVLTLDRAGVVESFPLPGGARRLVAWHDGSGDPAERLRRAVSVRMGDDALAGRIERASEFGIRRVLLRRLRRGRVFVIGDAAHEISPIGGQGMNLGLLDAATLAPALAHWLREPTDLRPVDRWERDRLASARTAANLAGMNTAIGRARGAAGHAAGMAAVRAAAATPLARLAAHAYGMGLDRSVS